MKIVLLEGEVELQDPGTNTTFKVNGGRIKSYHGGEITENKETLELTDR